MKEVEFSLFSTSQYLEYIYIAANVRTVINRQVKLTFINNEIVWLSGASVVSKIMPLVGT